MASLRHGVKRNRIKYGRFWNESHCLAKCLILRSCASRKPTTFLERHKSHMSEAASMQVASHLRRGGSDLKILAIWVGSLAFGFVGGIVGQRFSGRQTLPANGPISTKAHSFELVDTAGRVVSVWRTDQWGRPFLGFSDAKWEGRIVIGPIDESDVMGAEPRDPNAPWGISVTAPGRTAYAALGTGIDFKTKKPTSFVTPIR